MELTGKASQLVGKRAALIGKCSELVGNGAKVIGSDSELIGKRSALINEILKNRCRGDGLSSPDERKLKSVYLDSTLNVIEALLATFVAAGEDKPSSLHLGERYR